MIFLETQTTGLDPRVNSIIDIGALEKEHPENRFYIRCRPFKGAEITVKAIEINGADWLNDKKVPQLAGAILKFMEWSEKVQDGRLGGMNVQFDFNFLRFNAEKCGIDYQPWYYLVDIHAVFAGTMDAMGLPQGKVSFNEIFDFVGIGKQPEPHSNSLIGAMFDAEAYNRLTKGKNLLPEFANKPVPAYLERRELTAVQRKDAEAVVARMSFAKSRIRSR